jgi:hypothetical protein
VSKVKSRWWANRLESPFLCRAVVYSSSSHSLGPSVRHCHFAGQKFLANIFLPSSSWFRNANNLYTTASLLTLRVPNLVYFFSRSCRSPNQYCHTYKGAAACYKIRPLTRGFTSHKIRAYNKETSADPAVAQKRSRLSESCCTACGVTICNEGAEWPYCASA